MGDDSGVLDALCLLCDCLEFGDQALYELIASQAGPTMIQVINLFGKDRFDLVQTSIFALGCLIYRQTESPAILAETIAVVKKILGNPQVFTDDKGRIHTCLDNAMSCLGKIIVK